MIRFRAGPGPAMNGVRPVRDPQDDACRRFDALLQGAACGPVLAAPGPRPGQCRLAAWRVRLCRGAFSGLEIEACLSGDGVSLRMTVPRPVPLSLGLALARHAVQVEMDVADAAPE